MGAGLTPHQIPHLVLPNIWTLPVLGLPTDVEIVFDALEHTGNEVVTTHLEYKTFQVVATEQVTVGPPGNLLCWVEISPYPSIFTALFYGAIGGGGGAIPPTAPLVEVGTGVNGTIHNIFLPWNIHSDFARLVIQTPVPAAADFWVLQGYFYGKTF